MITTAAQVVEAQGGELVHELPQADEVLHGWVTILVIYYLGKNLCVFQKSKYYFECPSTDSKFQVLFQTNPNMF